MPGAIVANLSMDFSFTVECLASFQFHKPLKPDSLDIAMSADYDTKHLLSIIQSIYICLSIRMFTFKHTSSKKTKKIVD